MYLFGIGYQQLCYAGPPSTFNLCALLIPEIGDGGIHGQLLRNNGFQGDYPGLTAYAAVGDVTISQDTANPVSTAILSSLKVAVPTGTTGMVGFSNAGYLGVPALAES